MDQESDDSVTRDVGNPFQGFLEKTLSSFKQAPVVMMQVPAFPYCDWLLLTMLTLMTATFVLATYILSVAYCIAQTLH